MIETGKSEQIFKDAIQQQGRGQVCDVTKGIAGYEMVHVCLRHHLHQFVVDVFFFLLSFADTGHRC
jgi:hypothetical protein